ncbi:MAG: helix-turn-helix domain-containing protein [Candidatus Paracaedibacteraceae bacterium]|nr:helix-turn-helix domain-containing protein [Candidatus Paracaedibacteraceae bacterium]
MLHYARNAKQLGHALRELRVQKGFTQKQLAERVGVWQETISNVERGSDGAKLETVFALLSVLDYEIEIIERRKGSINEFESIF